MRDRKKRNIIIGSLCCLLIIMGIGYAVLSQTLNISGTANMRGTWDIKITDISEASRTGRADPGTPTISSSGVSASFEANLWMPGDSITYNITVNNNGNIDAALKELVPSVENGVQQVKFSNNAVQGKVLRQNESYTFQVSVVFDENATEIPQDSKTNPPKYTISLTFVQYTGNSLYTPTNETTDNSCFTIDADGNITNYDKSCGTSITIPNEIDNITIETEDEGILVKADTIGSLEAVVKLLREMDIPIRAADIGDVNRRDIINSSIAYDENELHGAIIAFNVDVHPNSEEDLNNSEVKLFSGDVIYQILEEYEEWVKQKQEDKKKSFYDAMVKPAKFVSLPKLVFRQSKPAIIGIESLSGTLKQGQQLINKDGHVVGSIASMEDKGETLPDISRGQRVAMAIKDAIVGKDFEEGDELYVDIPEKHYKYIEREFKDKLTEDEFETLYEFLEIKRKQDPDWGSFGLFE